jgi:alcohol dehydrogenase class IV
MVKPFQFARLPMIFFGNGTINESARLVRKYGNRLILVTGKKSFFNTPFADVLMNAFAAAGITYYIISVAGEPSPEIIDQTVKDFRNERIDLVMAIGGGSVLDAGKAISSMMYKTGSVTEFLEGVGDKEHPGTKLPYIAAPTTSGTGSEATKNAVISRTGSDGFKKSLRHDNLVPDIAIIDPELTLSCPREITASCGMDCFTQIIESYLSDKSGEMTNAFAVEGLKAVKSSLVKSCLSGDDIEARTGMSFAALTSGICLANSGLGTVHGFASSIGGMYDIPHGLLCAGLMAKTNEINVRELRHRKLNSEALAKYAFLGRIFIDEEGKSDDYYIDGFINYLFELTHTLQLPKLGNYGVGKNDVELICSITENKSNPINLTNQDLSEILIDCIS